LKRNTIILIFTLILVAVFSTTEYLYYNCKITSTSPLWKWTIYAGVPLLFSLSSLCFRQLYKKELSFKTLLLANLSIAILAVFINFVCDQIQLSLMSEIQKSNFVDFVVDDKIKNYTGSALDIFAIEEKAWDQLTFKDCALESVALWFYFMFVAFIGSLVFKRNT